MPSCYLCGYPGAEHPLNLGKEFTGHPLARSPLSDRLCDRCNDTATPGARFQYAWYWNTEKNKGEGAWSKIFTRNTSWLLLNPRDLTDPRNRPYLGPVRDEGKGAAHELINMPGWVDIRAFLLDPPEPPFEVAIADSGQKHILFLSEPAHDRDHFPVQFELAKVWVERAKFAALLEAIETLLGTGFSKTEIQSDSPRIDRLVAHFEAWERMGRAIAPWRGTPLLAIALKCAQYPEKEEPKPLEETSAPVDAPAQQLTLF